MALRNQYLTFRCTDGYNDTFYYLWLDRDKKYIYIEAYYIHKIVPELLTHALWAKMLLTRVQCLCTVLLPLVLQHHVKLLVSKDRIYIFIYFIVIQLIQVGSSVIVCFSFISPHCFWFMFVKSKYLWYTFLWILTNAWSCVYNNTIVSPSSFITPKIVLNYL